MLDIEGRIEIGMRLIAADLTAKRLLVWSVSSVYIMTHAAFLGGIGTLDTSCLYASLGGIPGNLFRDVCEIRGAHISIHGAGLVLHRRYRELFIRKLCLLMPGKALVDRPVDLLTDVTGEALPASACGGGQLLDPFLHQALAPLGLAPPFLPVALLSLSQFAVKGAIVLAGACGQEVGDAHVHPDHRGRWRGLYWNHLVVGESQPPVIASLVQSNAGIDGLARARLAVVVGQPDGDQ